MKRSTHPTPLASAVAAALLASAAACSSASNSGTADPGATDGGAPSTSAAAGTPGDASAPDASGCDLPYVSAPDCATAHAMLLPASLPPARGNMYGDSADAATLGFDMFFDSGLGTGIACANCHAPELAFTDRVDVSKGKTTGVRNAPTIFNAARFSVLFWDGRADSVWSQPLFPIENPAEMASSRLALAQYIGQNYASAYAKVFGALPDMSTWPASGMPGDPTYDALPDATKDQINRIAANVGKAFEAYMRKNSTGQSPFDQFLSGTTTAMSDAAARGFGVFLANKCQTCHGGPLLSDEAFHNEGFPSLADAGVDQGQAGGLPILQASVFNLAGPYADPGPGVPGVIPAGSGVAGAFRTPSLRNVMSTFPYGHDGALATIPDVLAIHAPGMSADDQTYLSVFFQSLTGADPGRPWDNWPSAQ